MHKQDRQLRVGILGCGPIAQFAHFESTVKGHNTRLYAICDAAEDLAARMGATYGPDKIYHDYDAMLADPELEAVIIATSDAFHVPAAMRALEAGKHVMCEKPVGLDVEEVEALAQTVRRTGKILQIGHMKRFDPGIEAAKRFIDEEMGERLALKAWYCDSTHRYTMTDAVQPLPVLSKAALKPKDNPKADLKRYYMLAHGSHLVDIARHLCGPIDWVRARLLQRFGAYSWFVETGFADGTLGHLDLTVAVRMDWHEGFQLYGEHGSVIAKTYNPWYYKSSDVEIFRERTASYERPLGADGHFYRRQLEGFADSVLDGAPMLGADIEDGIASVKAMAAIARSVETGEAVDVASMTGAV
ncbi:Gfo/Idh/MocA family protein [Allorhizobium taibaishanense]|uniref:Oxidoreductase n=1 Tax=Allorhizobium taibaishanense TaxID=887144 RepID=A0A1Q9A3N6_9HYPH|nr:Gfo/Idh/MocA family oxidoreductase [Allorhizobium taibaishanense]MBB4006232.1 putative dehydrogenase [Allorhizobium taibaishanense]OLP49214.1 oxidoreductase [Allorhizobium taibaishanense]